ncbi:electron transfer flavoprotein beta subunit [Bacilli bacterium PM5-3]|nr:electron transfer flavoprotein beta subunit [Bacilli bacterium PM5-3]MDH6603657.1 electron transfer flavoprotein beta subunit [Bacilli bacterium PM5-9]
MNIVVLIKQVPDTTEIKVNFETGTLIRDGVKSIMNPDDRAGLEEALKIKDASGAHVTVVTMGPPQADSMLREALAMGADEAILVSDGRFAGADTWATSSTIAGVLNKLDFDLIIAGRQAIDGDTAQVGPQTAEKLNIPHITYVEEVVEYTEKDITVHRQYEDGYHVIKAEFPCLLTTLTEMNKPRYMSTNGIVDAFEKEVKVWTLDDIEVDVANIGLKGSPTKVRKTFTKEATEKADLFEGTAQEAAALITKELASRNLI